MENGECKMDVKRGIALGCPLSPLMGALYLTLLDARLVAAGLEGAPRALERCVERVSRLYEQGVDLVRIGAYVRRWLRWARTGLWENGAKLCVSAVDRLCRSLGRAVLALRGPHRRCLAAAVTPMGEDSGTSYQGHPQGCRFGNSRPGETTSTVRKSAVGPEPQV